jgi:hypothetical protein
MTARGLKGNKGGCHDLGKRALRHLYIDSKSLEMKGVTMGVGVTRAEPITATRAVLRIEEAKVVDSKFTDQKGRALKQFSTELKVLSGAGERNGETFTEWLSFLATGEIGPKTKTGQVLTAALGDNSRAGTLEELADRLVGKTFASQIGTSKDGEYSRVVHDTVAAAPVRATEQDDSGKVEADVVEEEFSDISF